MSSIDPIKKITEEIKDLEARISYPPLMKQTKRKAKAKKKLKDEEIYTTRRVGEEIVSSTPIGIIKYDLTDDGEGKKYDNGKPMPGTLVNVFPRALLAVGACIEFGTHKYPNPNNWKQVEGANKRYQDSLMRHLVKHNLGEEKDRETSIPHLAHTAWNALAILELYLMEHPEIVEEYLK